MNPTTKVTKLPTKITQLDEALQTITKAYGAGSIMRLGIANIVPVEAISTSSISLDCALGVGGLPKGRIIEIFGPESSGKTTIMLHVIANTQKAGGNAAFIDAEHAFDPKYAKNLGVDLEKLLFAQPSNGEEALSIAETLIKSNAVDIVVIDSVAALVPKAELEGEMGMATMGMQARLMSQALRKLTAIINKSKTICCFTNQLRDKVGVMFGSPETTTGGKALKFYASVRLDIRRRDVIKDSTGNAIGNITKIKVIKNKVAPPFTEAEFEIYYGLGINQEGDIIEKAIADEIIQKKGAWIQYQGELIGQGKEAARQTLKDKPEIREKIIAEIKAKHIKSTIPIVNEPLDIDQAEKEFETEESTSLLKLIDSAITADIITETYKGFEINGKKLGTNKAKIVKILNEDTALLGEITLALATANGDTDVPNITTPVVENLAIPIPAPETLSA